MLGFGQIALEIDDQVVGIGTVVPVEAAGEPAVGVCVAAAVDDVVGIRCGMTVDILTQQSAQRDTERVVRSGLGKAATKRLWYVHCCLHLPHRQQRKRTGMHCFENGVWQDCAVVYSPRAFVLARDFVQTDIAGSGVRCTRFQHQRQDFHRRIRTQLEECTSVAIHRKNFHMKRTAFASSGLPFLLNRQCFYCR